MTIVMGVQAWQWYVFNTQMAAYVNIANNYQLAIATNEVKIALLKNPQKRQFLINGISIDIDNEMITFKLKDNQVINRKFIVPEVVQT